MRGGHEVGHRPERAERATRSETRRQDRETEERLDRDEYARHRVVKEVRGDDEPLVIRSRVVEAFEPSPEEAQHSGRAPEPRRASGVEVAS